MLGCFQKLLSSNMSDHFGFQIIQALVQHCQQAQYDPFVQDAMRIMFYRLEHSKTFKFVSNFLPWCSLLIHKDGPEYFVKKLGPEFFRTMMTRVWLVDVQKESASPADRKLVAIAMTDMLCKLPQLVGDPLWGEILGAVRQLFELPEVSAPEDDDQLEIEDSPGGSATFNQLFNARVTPVDPLASIPNPKTYFVLSLNTLSTTCPGKLWPLFSQLVGDDVAEQYARYFSEVSGQPVANFMA